MPTLPSRSLVPLLVLLALSGLLTGASPARGQTDPDFSSVSDVLQGRRRLLPVDDLTVTSPTGAGGAVNNLVLPTSNSSIGTQASYPITTASVPSFSTAVGRMFNLPRDIIFTAANGAAVVRDLNPGGQPSTSTFAVSGNPVGLAMTDFNFDGFADIALLTANGAGSTSGLLRIVSASNVNSVGQGLFVSTGVSPLSIDFTRPIAIAAGSFYGDGTRQVVLAQSTSASAAQYLVQVYTVAVNQDGTFPQQALQLAASGTFGSVANQSLLAMSALAGNFDATIQPSGGLPQDELAIVAHAGVSLTIQAFRIQPSSTNPITLVSTFVAQDTLASTGQFANTPFIALSARLNWFSAADQVAVAYTAVTNGVLTMPINVFVSDSQLNFSQATAGGAASDVGPVLAMAAGNFDQALGQNQPPNLELAVVTADNPNPGFSVAVLRLDPANGYAFSFGSNTSILPGVAGNFSTPFALVAGDLQGRSMLLGPPNKVTITQHQQPEVVLGAPPMHVDWIAPAGATAATPFNVTGVPNGFSSSYQTAQTGQNQSTSTSTTSFSYATQQSGTLDVSFGVPLVASVSASLTAIAQQTHDNVVSSVFDTYSSRGFDASTQTGFDDHVWYSGKRFNVYAYPVIGRCIACNDPAACTQPIDSCPAGSAPLILQFSGPDMIFQEDIDAANLEWYQPVHEVGQVLSYPWTVDQLSALFPGFQGLNCGDPACQQQPPPILFTDSSITTQQSTWGNGTSTQQTSGSTATSSFDTSVSVSASVSAVGDLFEVGGGGSLSFSYSTSQSIASLFSAEQKLGQSTGIGIAMPGTFQNPQLYQYAWQPFIFGQSPPAGAIQSLSLGTNVATSGPLRTAFTANPLDPNAGPWWPSAYTAPDVALNHPARWAVSIQTASSPPSNCLRVTPTSTTLDCLVFNAPDSTDVEASPFYWMKGFLITPVAANGTGPQIVQATAGDVLSLQVRVYNYSVVDMSPTTQVHVQFYGQPVEPSTGLYTGPSFSIGEQLLAPIPGFSGAPEGNPNWVLAATTFDTTSYADSYLVFWVVVWMEDGGALVAEVPDHGLTAIPASNLTSITQVPVEGHSNNVGYYRQTFYVASPSTGTRLVTTPDRLAVRSVAVVPAQVDPSGKVKVQAAIASVGNAADGVTVFFYDGVPGAGGRLFDVETIPHIRPDAAYLSQVLFRPRTCGPHTVFVVASPANGATASGSARLSAGSCSVSALTGSASRVGDGTDNAQVKIAGRISLPPTSSPNLAVARVTLQSLLGEASGAGELVDRVAAGFVKLAARTGGKPTSAIFESQPGAARPSFRMEIKQRAPGDLEFTLAVDRAVLSHDPARCSPGKTSTTSLSTSFLIDDGQKPPVMAATSVPWECVGRTPQAPSELRRR